MMALAIRMKSGVEFERAYRATIFRLGYFDERHRKETDSTDARYAVRSTATLKSPDQRPIRPGDYPSSGRQGSLCSTSPLSLLSPLERMAVADRQRWMGRLPGPQPRARRLSVPRSATFSIRDLRVISELLRIACRSGTCIQPPHYVPPRRAVRSAIARHSPPIVALL